jgi:hypothetical protein
MRHFIGGRCKHAISLVMLSMPCPATAAVLCNLNTPVSRQLFAVVAAEIFPSQGPTDDRQTDRPNDRAASQASDGQQQSKSMSRKGSRC